MIDPGSLRELVPIDNSKQILKLTNVPVFDFELYDIYDEKDFKKYIADIEKEVRGSFEYRRFIKFLRENLDMNKCAFLENVEVDGSFTIKIEQHHYPFTLYDIVIIVFNKRMFYHESLELEMVAKEVMELHYKLVVGIIPLSQTAHELVHNQILFIPTNTVLGRYDKFVDMYKEFMLPEHLDVLERIEEYSKTINFKKNNRVLEQHNTYLEIDDGSYKLPKMDNVCKGMIEQINSIKQNGYRLPTITDEEYNQKLLECKEEKKPSVEAIFFF